jgi:hydroxymethylpyrimidine/phosphomethylpyrimidine kinase
MSASRDGAVFYPDRVSDRPVPAVLSIAGSDSGGGAGIQADLKAFARCGVHGMTAIAALTAQNTAGVTGIHQVPGDFIVAQVKAVVEDIGVDAVKIGMLGTAETVRAVREALDLLDPDTPVVLDPVMVAESGAVLLDEPARAAIVEELLPRASVITPNVPEARVLAGDDPDGGDRAGGDDGPEGGGDRPDGGDEPGGGDGPDGGDEPGGDVEVERLARRLHGLGPAAVVVTGGHRDEATDLFFDGERFERIPGARYPDGAAHGSGCTHSSALAAHLALGYSPLEAARAARRIAGEAVRDGIRGLGAGPGPVDVFALTTAPRGKATAGRAAAGPLA